MESGQQTIHKYLIKRSKEGDRQAQNELYKLYAGAMYNICRRMMGDEDEAKDVLQEAFISAFGRINSLKEESMFTAWLKRIVVNHCLNAIKKRKEFLVPLGENDDFIHEEESLKYSKYEVKQVMAAIDQLPDGARTVLNLYLFEGYDHKEIGQILSITESASKAQYSKAKSRIRTMVEAKSV